MVSEQKKAIFYAFWFCQHVVQWLFPCYRSPKALPYWTKPLPWQLLPYPFRPLTVSPFMHSLFGA